ncbi:hypothetical protein D9M68_989840 [compost metagenome]
MHVRSAWLRMDGDMIIRQATFERGESGTTTKLDLVSPQAFAPEPPDMRKDKSTKSAGKRDLWGEAIGEEESK